MDANQKPKELSDYAKETILHKARQIIGKAGFTKHDLDDLMQELTLDLLERLPKFDPNKAAHTTFVARVIERKISKLIRHRKQEKRDYRRETNSLSESVETEFGSVERAQTISQDEYDRRIGRHGRTEAERLDMHLDVSLAIAQLPPDLKPMAERLLTHSITEVAREFGISRGHFYEVAVARLRAIFEDKGLGAYL